MKKIKTLIIAIYLFVVIFSIFITSLFTFKVVSQGMKLYFHEESLNLPEFSIDEKAIREVIEDLKTYRIF
jgi:sensor histidine kinase regulating citrate/malate metabolism